MIDEFCENFNRIQFDTATRLVRENHTLAAYPPVYGDFVKYKKTTNPKMHFGEMSVLISGLQMALFEVYRNAYSRDLSTMLVEEGVIQPSSDAATFQAS